MTRRSPGHFGSAGRLSPAQLKEREEFIAARDAAVAAHDVTPLREWVRKVEAREEARHRQAVDQALGNRPGEAPRSSDR